MMLSPRFHVFSDLKQLQEEASTQTTGDEGLPAMKASIAKLTTKRAAYQAEGAKQRVSPVLGIVLGIVLALRWLRCARNRLHQL